jgi:hypothetical protein
MSDDFEADSPSRRSGWRSPYDHYAEIDLRMPEKQSFGVPLTVLGVVAGFVVLGVAAVFLLGVVFFQSAPPAPAVFTSSGSASVSTTVVAAAPALALAEADELEGTWIAKAVIIDGEEKEIDPAKVKLTMDATGFKLDLPGMQSAGHWVKRVAGELRTMLLVSKDDEIRRAVYEIEDDTLKLCIAPPSEAGWPNDFTVKQGSKRMLLILKRQEEEP